MRKLLRCATTLFLTTLPVVAAYATDTDPAPASTKSSATTNQTKYPGLDQLSGTFDLTSNYIFRGVSQSSNYPAAQGGLTYTFPAGFYLNVWGSNVSFTGTKASVELDTIAGISGNLWTDLAYNLNIDRYNYPGTSLAYNEFNSVFNYKFIQAAFSYSGNAYASHKSGTYYNAGINYDVPAKYAFNFEDVNFQALFGHYVLSKIAGGTYNDYLVSISKKIKCYTFTVAWTDTNGGQHNAPYDGSQFVGTIGAEF